MTAAGKVLIVDDEPALCRALERLLQSEGFEVACFGSAAELLERAEWPEVGCLVLDVAMPGMDGIELQRALAERGIRLPIVFLTGHGDIPMSVRAMRAGAVDFLTKPVTRADLLEAVRQALEKATAQHETAASLAALEARLARLTPREREVFEHVIAGKPNKRVANQLGTSEQTIKVHRARVLEKLEVRSVAELVQIAQKLGIEPAA